MVQKKFFSRWREPKLALPDLSEVQTASWRWFVREGIKELFDEIEELRNLDGEIDELNDEDDFNHVDITWSTEEGDDGPVPTCVIGFLRSETDDEVEERLRNEGSRQQSQIRAEEVSLAHTVDFIVEAAKKGQLTGDVKKRIKDALRDAKNLEKK